MERVTGIGGLFFRASDPDGLSTWYERHLGVRCPPPSYEFRSWDQEAGPTVFAPFPSDSVHFRRPEQQWAINFQVRDLDAMVAQLRGSAIDVDVHAETYPNGRFADLVDPAGESRPALGARRRGRRAAAVRVRTARFSASSW